MRFLLGVLLVVLFSSLSYGQGFNSGRSGRHWMDDYTSGAWAREPLADLNAGRYDSNSLRNPYGAGSRYKSDGLMNPYSQYGSPYSDDSWTNPYATNSPRIYSGSGRYHGELSSNRFDPDSTSNPYGRYGSRFSPDSINNPYGAGSPYSTQRLYVQPRRY